MKNYTTDNMNLCAFLKGRGHRLVSIKEKRKDKGFFEFHFEDNGNIQCDVMEYFNDAPQGIRTYLQQITDLRQMMKCASLE